MIEAAHHVALLPLLIAAAYRRRAFLALAFGVSWIGDSAAYVVGGGFGASYVWLPLQFGLVLVSVGKWRWSALLILAVVCSVWHTYPAPDFVITTAGSMLVLAAARETKAWWTVALYFGIGTIAYLWTIAGNWDPGWYLYQGSRLAAIVAFWWLCHTEARHAREV